MNPGVADRRRLLRWAVVGLAVIVALIAWLATRGGDGSSEPAPAPEAAAARIVSPAQLREAAADLGQPVYWAGPIAGRKLELRDLGEGGGVQVLYLPKGAEAGEGSQKALTIGSYPLPDPAAAIGVFATRPGAIVRRGAGGREVVSSKGSPTSAYFASPEGSVQVEVYDPSPARAMRLARSARVRPVG
jgi:hypothetical protein